MIRKYSKALLLIGSVLIALIQYAHGDGRAVLVLPKKSAARLPITCTSRMFSALIQSVEIDGQSAHFYYQVYNYYIIIIL